MELFFEGDALYDDMCAGIRGARERVWVECYLFAADATGRRIAAALMRAARRGLDVRLHVDAAGSLFIAPRRFLRRLRAAGVRVREFHRWSWRDPWRYNRRNHCKLLVVDERHVYLGGFNIHDASSRRRTGLARWRDTHVRLDDQGHVRQAAELFLVFWRRRVPRHLWRPAPPPDLFRRDALVTNRIPRHRSALRRLFREGVQAARRSVFLTTPYFVPDALTRRSLMAAAQRGVDVRLLLPAHSDQWVVQLAARHIYERLLRAGVRIYEYQPRPLHAKTVAVDGAWASIGSANLDYRSLFHNYEINFVTLDASTCAILQTRFELDLAESREVGPEAVVRRSWWERLGGHLAWRLRWWL